MNDTVIGLLCCLLSGVFFGSMLVPLKRFALADGMFVQWVQCTAVFMVGFIVNFIRNSPRFEPLAALGGAIFSTANLGIVPLISNFGISIAMLIWTTVQIVTGWSVARFGLLGLRQEIPSHLILNYMGVALTLCSGVMFSLIKENDCNAEITVENDGHLAELPKDDNAFAMYSITSPSITVSAAEQKTPETSSPRVNKRIQQILYGLLSVGAGILFGLMMAPVIYIQDNHADASTNGLDYAFSFYCGTMACSTMYFLLYSAIKRNHPIVRAELVLPSAAFGLMWAIAMTSWFVSSKMLTVALSYPITMRLPGVVASMWDVFFFKSIKGRRNLILLTAAIIVAVAGVIMVGLSNE